MISTDGNNSYVYFVYDRLEWTNNSDCTIASTNVDLPQVRAYKEFSMVDVLQSLLSYVKIPQCETTLDIIINQLSSFLCIHACFVMYYCNNCVGGV